MRDSGPGIPAEVRPRIFEALFTTRSKGTGLGLALCRRIVEAHGGTIALDPSDDADRAGDADAATRHGACFIIALPDADRFDGSV